MEEIEFSWWLFEGRLGQGKNVLPDGLNWLCYFAGSSKSHHEISISFIFLESPHQVGMKNVVKSSKCFFGYFNTLETHSELYPDSIIISSGQNFDKLMKKFEKKDMDRPMVNRAYNLIAGMISLTLGLDSVISTEHNSYSSESIKVIFHNVDFFFFTFETKKSDR